MSKKSIMPFAFEEQTVRIIERDGEPWFVLNDVCAVLDIANPRDAAARLDDYQKGVGTTDTLGGNQALTIVNESGIYNLIFVSRKPAAKAFNKWVTTEVLPSIRKYGFYVPSKADQKAALALSDESHYGDRNTKSPTTRFFEEVKRFERNNNCTFALAAKHIISKPTLKALEYGAGILPVMSKGNCWLFLLSMGFDLSYIVWGLWGLTESERQMRDTYRRAGADQRAHLRDQFEQTALALPDPLLALEEDDD